MVGFLHVRQQTMSLRLDTFVRALAWQDPCNQFDSDWLGCFHRLSMSFISRTGRTERADSASLKPSEAFL